MDNRIMTIWLLPLALGLSVVACGSDLEPGEVPVEQGIGIARFGLAQLDDAQPPNRDSQAPKLHLAELAPADESVAAPCSGSPVCVLVPDGAYAKGDPISITWVNTLDEGGRVVIAPVGSRAATVIASSEAGVGSGTFTVTDLPVGDHEAR